MKYLLLLVSALFISGCDELEPDREVDPPTEIKVKMPAGLTDCKTFRVYGENGFAMLVTRCPHSDTTTQLGGKGGYSSTLAEEEADEEVQ